jgi:hypothetical protein
MGWRRPVTFDDHEGRSWMSERKEAFKLMVDERWEFFFPRRGAHRLRGSVLTGIISVAAETGLGPKRRIVDGGGCMKEDQD